MDEVRFWGFFLCVGGEKSHYCMVLAYDFVGSSVVLQSQKVGYT